MLSSVCHFSRDPKNLVYLNRRMVAKHSRLSDFYFRRRSIGKNETVGYQLSDEELLEIVNSSPTCMPASLGS